MLDRVMLDLVRQQMLLENSNRKIRSIAHSSTPHGWLADSATWTYASATTFTVAGDVTAQFVTGLHLKLTQSATVKYFYVVDSEYDGSTNTTVTVVSRDQETPDTLANAAITAPYTWVSATDVTAGYVLQAGADGATWRDIAGDPRRASMWHGESIVLEGNALSLSINTAQEDNHFYLQTPGGAGDEFSHGCWLEAGTYQFSVLGVTGNGRGKLHWALDGNGFVSNQDWYSASAVYNVVKTTADIVVATSGWHTLIGTVSDEKNESSSGYTIYLTKYWFRQAAD